MYTLYKRNQYAQIFKAFDTASVATSGPQLRSEFEARYPPPWISVDEAFATVRSLADDPSFFEFCLTQPADELLTIENWKTYSFRSSLRNLRTGETVSNGNLSSGESIILALILLVHSWKDGKAFPKLLLLDEVDASLHPSTSRILMLVLRQMSQELGMRVVMATHSPTTVALAPEDSLVELRGRFDAPRLSLVGRHTLLDVLTEGYFTIHKASAIGAELLKGGIALLSEGNNAKHIAHALEVLGVQGVNVVTNISARSGDSQLRTIFDFFASIPGHGPMLFVWDSDASSKKPREDRNNTFGFVFAPNPGNTLATTGIENLYDEHVLAPFTSVTRRPSGQEHKSISAKDKKAIADHVCTIKNQSTFARYAPLVEVLRRLAVQEDGSASLVDSATRLAPNT
jgi:hypothetical protein